MKLKGKGHEVSSGKGFARVFSSAHQVQWGDASRLLSFYQEWLDDLFPKAKFVDALAMVEKAGHNKVMHNHRVEWINEGRPKMNSMQDDGDVGGATENQPGDSVLKQATRVAPIFDQPASGRPKTPDLDDLFDDDIYNATPAAVRKSVPVAMTNGDEPDEDELDALMAMDESSRPSLPIKPASGAVKSLFGDGKPKAGPRAGPQPDELDEWDALMAEAENGPPRQEAKQPLVATQQPAQSGGAANGDEDDLDALMAEAEAESAPAKPGPTVAPTLSDDEEAMAEMDGLW